MNIGSIGSYIQRAAKMYPDFVLGTGNEAFSDAIKQAVKNRKATNTSYFNAVWQGTKDGFVASERHNAQMIAQDGNFWKSTWKALKTTPTEISNGWKAGGQLAEQAGKTGLSKFWSQFKGSLKGVGKRMPLIGTIMAIGFELPNLFSAFKDEGLVGGLVETGKTGLRLGAGMTCAAIGQALVPIPVVGGLIGGLVGYMVGDGLMSLLTGKTHSEKKAAAEEQQQAMLQQQQQMMPQMPQLGQMTNPMAQVGASQQLNIPPMTMSPQQLMAMQQQLYGGRMTSPMDQDFMAMASGMNRFNYMC